MAKQSLIGVQRTTPKGRKFSLTDIIEKNRGGRVYVYSWDDCPEEIAANLTTTRMQFKTEQHPSVIDFAIDSKIEIANQYTG